MFVLSDAIENILQFSLNYYSDKILFLSDESKQLKTILRVKKSPSTFIYSQDNKLIKKFIGVVKIEKIIELTNNGE